MNRQGFFMQPPIRDHFVSHFQYTGENRMFSPPECDAIIALALASGFGDASIGNPGSAVVDTGYRAARVAMVPFQDSTQWIYERLTQRVQGANSHYDFTLAGLLEGLQVIQYDAPANDDQQPGHYDWHQDFGGGYMARRKLSVVTQLSAPEDYDGCRLTIMDPGPRELGGIYQERGAGVIFPSWTPHCVTNIERGRRYALVAWVHGPVFR